MKIFFLLAVFILCSCSLLVKEESLINSTKIYDFEDTSGNYTYSKKIRFVKDEFITRVSLKSNTSGPDLERTTSVSKMKLNKSSNSTVMLPKIAEHKVWFSKKLYYSKIEANPSNKTYKVTMSSPDLKWNGVKEFKVPNSKTMCWYSQLADCMKLLNLLDYSDKKKDFVIIWDSYPYHTEQLKGVTDETLFVAASVKYDDDFQGYKRFDVTIGNSSMVYFYNDKKKFQKAFWISQGISLTTKEKESDYK